MGDHHKNTLITVLGIYHPPQGNTNATFIEDVNQVVHYFITTRNNLVIVGDLNMHLQDLRNSEASIYKDTMEALTLTQNVLELTQKLGKP